jgi:class 3 adenylate cyclase
VKLKPVKLAPALIAGAVIVLVCLMRLLQLDFFERPEWMTYDMRVREALKFSPHVVTNLGFVDINDATIAFVKTNRSLGYRFGLYWPRQVYGRLVEELAAQKARAVALDVVFGELRDDHPPVQMADGRLMESDDFFALQMRRAGNVIIADTRGLSPPRLFSTNALALGDIATDTNKDSDGVLRRAQAFRVRRRWHPLFEQADRHYGVDLNKTQIKPGQIVFLLSTGDKIEVPLDSEGNFDLTNVLRRPLPPGISPKAKPFVDERVWHMGIVLAAQEQNLDLKNANVDLEHGRITLRGQNGIERIIPVDKNGYFYIDWSLTPNDPRVTREAAEELLVQDKMRLEGQTNAPGNLWADKLIVVGSSATGNDLTDRGATPLEKDTLLASEHWNVANSVLTGQFVRRTSIETDLLIIVGMGVLAAVLTWRLRVLLAFMLLTLSVVGYVGLGNYLYVQHRYWLPMILPLIGALLMTHVCLVTWRVVFEQAEKHRVKSIFSKIVSPNIVNELLQADKLSLSARREVTVLFADVRGFTEFTDTSQERAASYVSARKLTGAEAEAFFDEQARETLDTVNTYLSLVADMVKKHDGTLDKYIGDCVMAFWGSPTPNPKHALACVRAAADTQRAIYELNRQRSDENKKRGQENPARLSASLPPRPLLPLLLLGSGINTGMVTVGLMGSEAHISNYTVFGREVNLASRLESLSGSGRILISEATYRRLLLDDPALAATCVALRDAQKLKGISAAVTVYEVPWRLPETLPPHDDESSSEGLIDKSAATAFIQREKV